MAGPMRMTLRRTIGQACSLYSTVFAVGSFLAVAAALFVRNLAAAEGTRVALVSLWAVSASPVLPILAALLAMDVWSDERRSGRLDMLLTAPVRERELVLGKFMGVWLLSLISLIIFHIATIGFLAAFASDTLSQVPLSGFLPGFVMLMLQSALWSAASAAISSFCRHGAAAAVTSVALLFALPRGLWWALVELMPKGRLSLGDMPLDAHVYDMSLGLVSTGTVISYVLLTLVFLFITDRVVVAARFVGKGASGRRFSAGFAIVLALVFALEAVALAVRLDMVLDLPVGGAAHEPRISARTVSVLRECGGEIYATAFLPRKDSRFREVSHLLRTLANESETIAGTQINIRYVDPHWDFGSAERLVRTGAKSGSVIIERAHRMEILSIDGLDERTIASAILRVTMPPQRRIIYWTCGHGESSFDSYDAFGMSDIARALASDGYRNLSITLRRDTVIPSDCALIIIAGAKDDFSREERDRLDRFVEDGGRLLVMLNSVEAGGVATVLAKRGVRPKSFTSGDFRTLSGTDVIVSDFGDHTISIPLKGSQLVLDRPVAFEMSAAVSVGGADSFAYSELAKVGDICVAAASERGGVAGGDLAIRPSRVITIGDASFVMNGQLETRANANRDFFLNCVAYLAGSQAVTEPGIESDRLVSGMDSVARMRYATGYVIIFPSAVFLLLLAIVSSRRRRA